jgi:hypothetical protein
MSIPVSYIGISGDRCSCGRRASIRHCPECGSFRLALKRGKPLSEARTSRPPRDIFRCIRCGFEFDDEMRVDCTAPVYRTKQQIAALEILRIRQEKQNGYPLTDWEAKLLQSIDLISNRYKRDFE